MFNAEQMMYASVSSGYKSGGFRLGSLRINAALYVYDYSDMQVLVLYLHNVNLPVEEIINVDEPEVKGFELESTWLATDALTLMLNYSYVDGGYTSFCCTINTISGDSEPQDLSGNPLTQAPKDKFSLTQVTAGTPLL